MTEYRAGQRVRIEVEGWVAKVYGPRLIPVEAAEDPQVITVQVPGHGHMEFSPSCSKITVLAEPRPEEPTGIGAVVEAGYKFDLAGTRKWVRRVDGYWEDTKLRGGVHWANLVDPVVLHEGWTP